MSGRRITHRDGTQDPTARSRRVVDDVGVLWRPDGRYKVAGYVGERPKCLSDLGVRSGIKNGLVDGSHPPERWRFILTGPPARVIEQIVRAKPTSGGWRNVKAKWIHGGRMLKHDCAKSSIPLSAPMHMDEIIPVWLGGCGVLKRSLGRVRFSKPSDARYDSR